MSEHDFEPIRGLPGNLPAGETILWQGSPDWRLLASQAFHVRLVAAYFALMLLWRIATSMADGDPAARAIVTAASVAPIALAGLGLLAFLAWLNARTTVYTITSRRVVLRFGAAVPKAINIPFKIIERADMRLSPDGSGDIALTLQAPNKIAFLQLWPHARPWRMRTPSPSLRSLRAAGDVAATLAAAMREVVPVETPSAVRAIRGQQTASGLVRPDAVAA
jgi:hypothetical protein